MVAVIEKDLSRGSREIALLGFSSCALFLFIALLSFSSEDPGWSHSTSFQSIHNACGLFGAWLADFILSFLGLMAYLIPVMIFWSERGIAGARIRAERFRVGRRQCCPNIVLLR